VLIRRNTEEVQGSGDWQLFDELFADNLLDHTPQPNCTPDKAGALGLYRKLAKGVIQEFFKQEAKYRYFVGCSNGGRNAAIAVQRWPEEFDGAVSGCYGFGMPGQTVAWTSMAGLAGTPAMPSTAQWSAVYQAAVSSCDAADNLADGVISNPSKCTFDPSTQVCGQPLASADPAVCLTPTQLPTVQKLFAGGWTATRPMAGRMPIPPRSVALGAATLPWRPAMRHG
jgi:hypothetical protein